MHSIMGEGEVGENERKGSGRAWLVDWDEMRKPGKLGEKVMLVGSKRISHTSSQTMGFSGRLAGSAGKACDS